LGLKRGSGSSHPGLSRIRLPPVMIQP
jgi:hypothetical protein